MLKNYKLHFTIISALLFSMAKFDLYWYFYFFIVLLIGMLISHIPVIEYNRTNKFYKDRYNFISGILIPSSYLCLLMLFFKLIENGPLVAWQIPINYMAYSLSLLISPMYAKVRDFKILCIPPLAILCFNKYGTYPFTYLMIKLNINSFVISSIVATSVVSVFMVIVYYCIKFYRRKRN